MANARVEVFSTLSLVGGSLVVYESNTPSASLLDRSLRPIARRIDLYGGHRALATGGTWPMQVFDPQGVFSEDGIFAQDLRNPLLVASVDDRVVFLGRAVSIKHSASTVGAITTVQWRDLVDDLAAQRIEGISSDEIEGQIILAQTTLHSILAAYGIPAEVEFADGSATHIPDLDLWFPEQSATIRQWILPVLSALGYAVDWSAAITGGSLTSTFALTHESRFRNRQPGLPIFTDNSLIADKATWDDGRAQVFNIWTGRRRVYDAAEMDFRDEELTEDVSDLQVSQAFASRARFGARRVPLDVSAIRGEQEDLLGYIRAAISRRLWPHPRGKMSLSGPDASNLRIGDGFVSDFKFNSNLGRGLARVWRVIGRTIDLQDDVIEIEAEMRDARDEDYQDWAALGYPTVGGDVVQEIPALPLLPTPEQPEQPAQSGAMQWGSDSVGWGADAAHWGGDVV